MNALIFLHAVSKLLQARGYLPSHSRTCDMMDLRENHLFRKVHISSAALLEAASGNSDIPVVCGTLMSNDRLHLLVVPVSNRLSIVDDLSELILLLLRQVNLPGSPVFLKATGLRRAWNSDHPLSRDPRQCNLG